MPVQTYPTGNAVWSTSTELKEETAPWDSMQDGSFPGIVNIGGGVVDGIYEGGIYPWANNQQKKAPWGAFQSDMKSYSEHIFSCSI